MTFTERVQRGYQVSTQWLSRYLEPIALLMMRLLVARVFLQSGLSKWHGWFDFNETKYDLFLYEFFCPDPVRPGALLLCDPQTLDYQNGSLTVTLIETLALVAGIVEVLLPLMLVVGLLTRPAALGLIAMTLFIQLAVFPTWSHWWNPAAWWFVVLLGIFAAGPGALSLDRWVKLETRRS
ncbi:DoxX family protein [Saccharospirillum impatiens]|uniref:DoxX family protein n=1 Tax=Saccharospirillum impatiens TaxID=169438 RepID=UPI0003F60599|nr:DoxX family protein [Saccharospirillum impatiens]